ncbi:MAG: endopeptidase La [Planctomycetes bacterium]|nr:endopeptidase La [Planctomycetota bacterium]
MSAPNPPAALPVTPAEERPARERVILVPVRSMVLFPGVVLPVMIGRERSVRAVQEAVRRQAPVGVVLQRDETIENPARKDLHDVGTLAEVMRYLTAPDGKHHAICQGTQRFRLLTLAEEGELAWAEIERIEESEPARTPELEARFLALKQQAQEVLQMAPGAPEELSNAIAGIGSPSMLADMVATFLDIPLAEKQELLETIGLLPRLDKVAAKLGKLRQVLELSHKIRQETAGELNKAQREYFLREQLKQIQKELSGGAGEKSEITELREALERAAMPEEAKKQAQKELVRLERMNESAAEYSMLRTYLEVLSELPWSQTTEDNLDIERARTVLEEDHHGLEKVKRAILEYLAVLQLAPKGKRSNLCLVGPPGVGKTSLGQSIARAMGRKFVRVSLGGVHDEAEIRGHRRTYIGALPGNVVQGLRKAGSRNPVFLLDEMDKLGAGIQGDPSSALLEVLDPEQNRAFRDNYLGVPFDLSRVLFIGTANVLDGIPPPLRDRFEIIHLPGYTASEKLAIARRYLVHRQLEANGLSKAQFKIDAAALKRVVREYTREAGVRNLERQIGQLVRHAAVRIVEKQAKKVSVGVDDLHAVLGPPRFQSELAERTALPGVATGLAWTPVGGEILFVEATAMKGRGKLTLTGHLGEVMKESAQAAMTLVRARAEELGLDAKWFETHDLHVHLPAGAIPKDGPSAGVTLYTALVSLITGRRVRSGVAMTGEISLRGLVLPVGGIKEKVLGALAAGIGTVLLPERNRPDLEDVPKEARAQLKFVFLKDITELARHALEPVAKPSPKRARKRRKPAAAKVSRVAGAGNAGHRGPVKRRIAARATAPRSPA